MLQRLSALSADTLAKMTPKMREFMERPAMTFDPRNAELLPGAPAWYVIQVWPNKEMQAKAKLAERQFGIYVPMSAARVVKRGRTFSEASLIFPGYIFAFVWDVLQHRSRIEAIEGVNRVILDIDGVPLPLSDDQISYIRGMENAMQIETVKARRLGRRLTRQSRIRP